MNATSVDPVASVDPSFDPAAFDIEALVRRANDEAFSFEYNCHMRRLYPWAGTADTKRPVTEFGLVWVEVAPGTDVDRHAHDEEESFLIVSGAAELELEGRTTVLRPRDLVYIPRFWHHRMGNPFDETLVFVDLYWDHRGRAVPDSPRAVPDAPKERS